VKGNMGAQLQVVNTKYVARSRKYAMVEEAISSSRLDPTFGTGQQAVMKRKARTTQESRIARVEALRARVRAGTYEVDSTLLAQRMLANESSFMENSEG